jgi:ABC-type branched-subunit amino acid transport system ATPase component
LGGALIGYSRGQLSPQSFGVFVGLTFLAVAYLGGITSASGAVVAGALAALGIVFVFLDRVLELGQYYALFSGLSLLVTVVLNPLGIAGKTRSDVDELRRKRAVRNGLAAPGGGEHETALVDAADVETAATAHVPAESGVGGGVRQLGDVVLRTVDVTVSYGGLKAVNEVSIDVRAGEIVGLIGPNGAGKTSFIDAITGFTPCTGEVFLGDEELTNRPAHQRARSGLVRTWQSVELFEDLSAQNNVRVADDIGKDVWKLLRDTVRPNPPPSDAVRDAMALMALTDVADRRPSELSLGRQKTLGVARSLALKPRALLLDEPAAGLDTAESIEFGEHLKQIASTGVGCLLIDHDMHLVLGVCDRIYVIEFGRQIASGRPDEVRKDPAVVAAYLGSEHVAPESVTVAP